MTTEWFDRKPGDRFIKVTEEGTLEIIQNTGDLLPVPDWVRIPDEVGPPLAGMRLSVTRNFISDCPLCRSEGAKIVELETPCYINGPVPGQELHSSECTACGKFAVYWKQYDHTPKPPAQEQPNADS